MTGVPSEQRFGFDFMLQKLWRPRGGYANFPPKQARK